MLVAGSAWADDIDVYTAATTNNQRANVLFVLDYSGSMARDIDGVKGSGKPSRISILKDAMSNMLTARGPDGEFLSKFNGGLGSLYSTGASGIRWPLADLRQDANRVDPAIAPDTFTNADIILKQLERTPVDGWTNTVGALVESARYFRGDTVSTNAVPTDRPWPYKPDAWNPVTERYEGGNPFAALPTSYKPRNRYVSAANAPGQVGFCHDYSSSGGENRCAGKVTYDCQLRDEPTWNAEDGSWRFVEHKRCKFDHPDQWLGADYDSPVSHQCQANHIVLISDGKPTRFEDSEALRELAGIADASKCEDLSTSVFGKLAGEKTDGNCGPELLKALNSAGIIPGFPNSTITTHTVGFSTDGAGSDYLEKLATAGGGDFYPANTAEALSKALSKIAKEVSGNNENFAQLAIDVDKAAFSHDNRVYISLFKPSTKRAWNGNLKGYFIDRRGLVDMDDHLATSDSGGATVISPTARSFWSEPDNVDGDDPLKGGASAMLEKVNRTRKLYTWLGEPIPAGGTRLYLGDEHRINQANGAITPAMLGVTGKPRRDALLDWVQTAPMGSVLHSRAVTVRYADKQVVYVMTNQGFLHAIDATDPKTPGDGNGSNGGEELFAFMPGELLDNLEPDFTDDETGSHVYGLDGGITRWHDDANNDGIVNGTDKLLLVFGMRRGGKGYYALDVTDTDTPTLKWTLSNQSDGFEDLAQSWSRMSLVKVKRGADTERVLMFGGGYDASVLDNTAATAPARGNALYMIDRDGARVWSATQTRYPALQYSIPSALSVIDSDGDSLADRAYVGDTGGQVWRIDFDDVNNGTQWKVNRLADFSASGAQPFFYPPSVSLDRRGGEKAFLIAQGSGNRAQPLLSDSTNAFFMVRDEDVAKGAPTSSITAATATDLYNATNNDLGSDDETTRKKAEEALENARGWRISLASGEKSLSAPVVFEGRLLATTFQALPNGGSKADDHCGFDSIKRYYSMNLATGEPVKYQSDGQIDNTANDASDRSEILEGPGIPSSPLVVFPKSSGMVQVLVDKKSVNLIDQQLTRVFWHSR